LTTPFTSLKAFQVQTGKGYFACCATKNGVQWGYYSTSNLKQHLDQLHKSNVQVEDDELQLTVKKLSISKFTAKRQSCPIVC